MGSFEFTDEEFLQIINTICKKESPLVDTFIPITDMEESLVVDRLDSLGVIIFFVWLSELFGISDDDINAFTGEGVFTIRALKEFVTDKHTRTYSYAQAEEFTKRCS